MTDETNQGPQEPTLTQKQMIETFMQTVSGNILAECEHYFAQGIPRELFLTASLTAIAQIAIDCSIPTAKLGMALATARQVLDDNRARQQNKN